MKPGISRKRVQAWALVILSVLVIGCGKQAPTYNPVIDPANFVASITNPYMPLTPGTILKYRVRTDTTTEDVTIMVSRQTREVMGVTCLVVHDLVTANGQTIEDTWDWYAQDKAGNVWYFGEDTKKYDSGKVSTEGSWEAGVKGAKPGIVMEAHPKVGDAYYQEYAAGVAEDRAEVLSLNESATVPNGSYRQCLMTKDWSRLKAMVEHKVFCLNTGQVLAAMVQGGTEREELLSIATF